MIRALILSSLVGVFASNTSFLIKTLYPHKVIHNFQLITFYSTITNLFCDYLQCVVIYMMYICLNIG